MLTRATGREPTTVCDPWNGSGTTTVVAQQHGHNAIGFDISPVMTLVAQGRHLPVAIRPSLRPLARELLEHCDRKDIGGQADDPLNRWFTCSSTSTLRRLQLSIHKTLVEPNESSHQGRFDEHLISPLSGFFYTAAFIVIRRLLDPLFASNPTWLKAPRDKRSRRRPSVSTIEREFLNAVQLLSDRLAIDEGRSSKVTLEIADSRHLPLPTSAVDLIVTSPPYCTRLDYAMATRGELAFLGLGDEGIRSLREKDFGSPISVNRCAMNQASSYVDDLIRQVAEHQSKASDGYYRRYFERYFSSLSDSLTEISRILRPTGQACVVVQDSYYKEIHVDLQRAIVEIAAANDLKLIDQFDYNVPHSRSNHNPRHREYSQNNRPIESVLIMKQES